MVENPENQRPIPAALTPQSEHTPRQNSGQKLVPGGAYRFSKMFRSYQGWLQKHIVIKWYND
jgi:hypothetical protein